MGSNTLLGSSKAEIRKADSALELAFLIFYYDKNRRDKALHILTELITDHPQYVWYRHIVETLCKLSAKHRTPLHPVSTPANNIILLARVVHTQVAHRTNLPK